jgi:hypothetical protein
MNKEGHIIPTSMPVFTIDDILEPPSEEYEVGEVRSTIGWLKHLFLYSRCPDQPDCINISTEDRRDYKMAVDKFRFCAKMKKTDSLSDWEDETSRKTQASTLNKLRRSLGYTEIVEV